MIHKLAGSLLALGIVAVSTPSARAAEGIPPQTDIINKYIAQGWENAGIKPTNRATDHEFLRRAFIDLIGRIPTVEEVLDFEQDRSSTKRARLIHRLLYAGSDASVNPPYRPRVQGQFVKLDGGKRELAFNYAEEYAMHWSNIWTVALLSRSRHPVYHEQMRYWLDNEFLNNTSYRDLVVKLLTATGKTNENGAVNFIIHHLGESNPEDKRSEFGPFDAVPITSRVTRLFLGLQTQCVQCHDHPFNREWVQSDFWGVNAFFRQTVRDKTPTGVGDRRMMANPERVTLSDETSFNPDGIIFYERRDGKLMAIKPNFLKDYTVAEAGENQLKTLQKAGTTNRREALAQYVINHDNFHKAYVNRIWGHLFGRGLHQEPSVDDFGTNNEVVHPELLDSVAQEFGKYQDMKMLLEWICNSDAYNLSHVASRDATDPKFDPYFARMPLKAMSPEVLFESLMTATKAEAASDADARRKLREDWMSKLVRNFGDDEGNEITFNGTVIQALLMMNGRELNSEINRQSETNPVRVIAQKHTRGNNVNARAIIDELFLTTLNRHPTGQELDKILTLQNRGAIVAAEGNAQAAPAPPPPKSPLRPGQRPGAGRRQPTPPPVAAGPRVVPPSGPNDLTFYQDVFWALLNTNEFMLNH